MEHNVFEYLKAKGYEVGLKSYKEALTSDGYFMQGVVTVNGMDVFECEDGGYGGGVFYHIAKKQKKLEATSKENALNEKTKQLANDFLSTLKEYENLLKVEEKILLDKYTTEEDIKDIEPHMLNLIVLERHGYSFYDYTMDVEKLFTTLAEQHLSKKQFKRKINKSYMFAYELNKDILQPIKYIEYKKTYEQKRVLQSLLKEMKQTQREFVYVLNELTLEWNKKSINDIEIMGGN